MRLDRVPPNASRGHVHVLVDTPAGSANKYKLDEQCGLFRAGVDRPRQRQHYDKPSARSMNRRTQAVSW